MEIKKVRKTVEFDFKMKFKYGDAVELLQVGDSLYFTFPGVVCRQNENTHVVESRAADLPVKEKELTPDRQFEESRKDDAHRGGIEKTSCDPAKSPDTVNGINSYEDGDDITMREDMENDYTFSEPELKEMPVNRLAQICRDRGIPIPRDEKRNTNKRFRELILDKQREKKAADAPNVKSGGVDLNKPTAVFGYPGAAGAETKNEEGKEDTPPTTPKLVDLEGNEYMHGEKITVVSQAGDYQATVDGLVTVDEDNNVITDGSHGNTYVKLAMPGDGEDCFDSFYKLKFRGWE